MNVFADESVDGAIVRQLRADGHEIEAVSEGLSGTVDDDVLAIAASSGRVLLTADKDFGELVYRLRRAHAGVVLLRQAGMPSIDRVEAVSTVFRDRSAELPGAFTVIDRDSVRVRVPPDVAPNKDSGSA